MDNLPEIVPDRDPLIRGKYNQELSRLRKDYPDATPYLGLKNPYTGRKVKNADDFDEYLRQKAITSIYQSLYLAASEQFETALSLKQKELAAKEAALAVKEAELAAKDRSLRTSVDDLQARVEQTETSRKNYKSLFFVSFFLALALFISCFGLKDDGRSSLGTAASAGSSYTASASASSSGSYDKGYADGKTSGYTQGYDAGQSTGYSQGYDAGKSSGYSAGYSAGVASSQRQDSTVSKIETDPPATASIPNEITVYVTNSGKKYHKKGCSYLKSSHAISLTDAKSQGYTPCSRCKPDS